MINISLTFWEVLVLFIAIPIIWGFIKIAFKIWGNK